MNTVATNVRLDKETKDEATQILDGLGLSLSTAFNMFLKQITLRNGLPFSVEYPKPSRELLKAMKEADKLAKDPNAKTYDSFEEALDDMGIKL